MLLLDDPLAGLSANETERLVSWLEAVRGERLVLLTDPGRGVWEHIAEGITQLEAGHRLATNR
jgi:ABC-type uncharacterized transport system ATPase subunit